MARRHRGLDESDEKSRALTSNLIEELERLGQETETDKLLDALERELHDWAPEGEDEDRDVVIERLNRRLISRSVFREGLDDGFHEDSAGIRPMESEVRKGLEELKKLIELGKHSR